MYIGFFPTLRFWGRRQGFDGKIPVTPPPHPISHSGMMGRVKEKLFANSKVSSLFFYSDTIVNPRMFRVIVHISDLESRCPKGTKTVLYYRAKEEKFAEYLNQDGLVSKFTLYSDTASKYTLW